MTTSALEPSVARPGERVPATRRLFGRVWIGAVALLVLLGRHVPAQDDCVFIRGDVTQLGGSAVIDLNDAVAILAYLYLGVSTPTCPDAADINDNGIVEPSDYTYLVNYLFNDGPPPPPPFPHPGTDPTPGITVPDERDERFLFSIGSTVGVPSNTGLQVPVTVSSQVGCSSLQVVLKYNERDDLCPDLLVQEIRTEEGTLLSAASADYIIAEFDNAAGVAFISSLKDFATPFWFQVGGDPDFPPGEEQLLGTLVIAISSCASKGFSPIRFVDGATIAANISPPPPSRPEVHNLVGLGAGVVRPRLSEAGGIDIRRGFIRGDANKDSRVDISDAVFALEYIFKGGRVPPCLDAADANNDTRIDISDPIFLLNYMFQGGPQPSEPFPQAGLDPSDDGSGSLGCASDD